VRHGCVARERAERFAVKMERLSVARDLLRTLRLTPPALRQRGLTVNEDGVPRSAGELLRQPEIGLARLAEIWPELAGIPGEIAEQLEIDGRYAGYLARQEADIRAFRRDEGLHLPDDLDYDSIGSLSNEIRGKLRDGRPATLGAAARISGVTPAALVALLKHVRRGEVRARA
jgi:tRNA uridine 5-carboxymethylaminomethyl modification enzyme